MKKLILLLLLLSLSISAHNITKYNIDKNLLSKIEKKSEKFEINYKNNKINMLFLNLKVKGDSVKEKSENFINEFGNLFGIDNFNRLNLKKVIRLKTRKIVRFNHIEKGVEIINSEFILVFNKKSGNLTQITNSFDNVKIKILPSFLDKKDVIDIINAKYDLSYGYDVVRNIKLMAYPTNNEYYFLYRAFLPMAPHLNFYYDIDAENGKFLGRYNNIWHAVNAKVYQPSPAITSDPVEVELKDFIDDFSVEGTDSYHKLYGKNVVSHNCLNSEYDTITYQGYNGAVCGIRMDGVAETDGDNLRFNYDPDNGNPDDKFAPVQMYYHVNKVHNYFFDNFYEESSDPLMPNLFSIVNFQYGVDFGGIRWQKFNNAFFAPQEMASQLSMYGYDINEDVILFGEGDVDFSYDGDVVYHEYTHGVVDKTSKLGHNNFDDYGLSVEPGAMNEAYADYFAATITDDSVVGNFALAESARDLNNETKCPNDIVGEVHYDSVFYSGSLWDIREALGNEVADEIIFNGMASLAADSGMNDGRLATENAAEEIEAAHKLVVHEKFENHGLVECDRAIEYIEPITEFYISGINNQENSFRTKEYAPAFAQHKINLPEGKVGIKIKFSSQGAPGMLGSGEAPTLSVLFKKGSPITYSMNQGKSINDADMLIDTKIDNGEAILQGPCVTSGDWYIQFINYGKEGHFSNINISFIDFELVGPKYENCEENFCSVAADGYCEGNATCVANECVNNCSEETPNGYCEGGKCDAGVCKQACSSSNLRGYCEDGKSCVSTGECSYRCDQDHVDGHCDAGNCRDGLCMYDCSEENPNGYCEDSRPCENGVCQKSSKSSSCTYNSDSNNKTPLFLFAFVLIAFILRRRLKSNL